MNPVAFLEGQGVRIMGWHTLRLVVELELRASRRNRWVRAILFAWIVLGAVLAWSATPAHLASWQGWERTSVSLLPALLLLLPLAAMLTAIHATTGEASTSSGARRVRTSRSI